MDDPVAGFARGVRDWQAEIAANVSKEYRVRPVDRYILTRYTSHKGHETGRSEVMGEFPNTASALAAKAAFEAADAAEHMRLLAEQEPSTSLSPPERQKFVIVQSSMGEPTTQVYYAYSQEQANDAAKQFEASFGGCWEIYRQ